MSAQEAGEGPPARVVRVLLGRNFWPYFAGNLLSNVGTWFQAIAQVLLVYRLTRSSFLVGVVNFSQFAAVVALAPISGSAADRFDRRRLVLVTQLCAAALAAALALMTARGWATAPLVIAVALALGVTTALTIPARQAIVPSLVERAELSAAITLMAVTFNLARAVGPVIGVLVIARFGLATAFAVNAFSYVASIAGVYLVTPAASSPLPDQRPRLRESVRAVRADAALFVPVIVVGLVSLSADPVNTLTPAFATEVFGRSDTFTGFLVGAFGAGAVVGAFALTGRRAPSLGVIAVTLGLLAGGIATFALASSEGVALGGLFVGGFGYLASVSAATSLMHLAVEESHRGRVSALWSLSFHGTRPVGSLVDGALAALAGVRVAGLAMALPALAGCLLLGRRALRAQDSRRVEPRTTSSGSSR